MKSQGWIFKPSLDLTFIIFPGIVSVVFLFILKKYNILPSEINPWTWFCTVLLIDVAHVYSTLFRSYFNMEEWREKKSSHYTADCLFFIFDIFIFFWNDLVLENHGIRRCVSFHQTTIRIFSALPKENNFRSSSVSI